LLFLDAGCAALTCWLSFLLRFEGDPVPSGYVSRYWAATSAVAIAYVLMGRVSGLYRRQALRMGDSMLGPAFEAAIATGIVVLTVNYAVLDGKISRAWIGLVILGLLFSAMVSRGILRRARRALVPLGIALERYAIVGDGLPARRLNNDLTRAAGSPYKIVDLLSPSLGAEMLAEMAAVERLDGLILTAESAPEHAADLATRLAGYGIDAFIAPRLGDLDMRVASIASFQGVALLRVAGLAPRRRAVRHAARRDLRRGVAILGTRGIPANYGGFETFAERLALHLVDNDVNVTVYCRRHHASGDKHWNGVRLVTLPTIRSKYLDTVVHTTFSAIHLLLRSRTRDVVLCNAANAPVLPLLRLFGCRVLMNVDGLEWRRGKWGVLGRAWYRMGEWLSVRAASVLITDADEVRTYYRVRHDSDSVMIPYGADLLDRNQELPAELGVAADAFALYVSRWERENNPLMVASAHAAAGLDIPLVMLGKATYDEELEHAVRAAAAATAVLPGPVFGDGYRALQSNARCYIHATEVGGTHPALIEAMGAANLILVLDTPENREVAGPDAWYFADQDELTALIRNVARLPTQEVRRLGMSSRDRAASLFSWSAVGDAYLQLLRGGSLPIDIT
jgi:glycosyltransferase involved in cell wall biosynthesis